MSTELVASTETKEVAMSEMMAEIGVQAQDLVIPKLLLMQNTSEYVGDEKAKLGDVVNSQTIEVLGGFASPVAILPLKLYKTWRVYDMSGGQPEFMHQDPVTPANEKQEWEGTEVVDGQTIPVRRDLCFNFFALLKTDIANGEGFPVVVSFKRTSMQAGRQLATQMFKMGAIRRPSYARNILLSVKKEKKDTNTYAVFECRVGDLSSEAEMLECKKWLGLLGSMKYTVDEKDEDNTQKPVAQPEVVGAESGSGEVF